MLSTDITVTRARAEGSQNGGATWFPKVINTSEVKILMKA
jgi:hypothetical protein